MATLAPGARRRPHYAPQPAGASHQDILTAKAQIAAHCKSLAHMKNHINHMEVMLTGLDPQQVAACAVLGYEDPPERAARATADREAGVLSVLTTEHVQAIRDGQMASPPYRSIYETKKHIAHLQNIMQHIEAHNDHLESELSLLDSQHVVAAKVADYTDPPETVARAEAAKAAGEIPAENVGV